MVEGIGLFKNITWNLITFHRYNILRGNWYQEKGEKTIKLSKILPCIKVASWNYTTSLSPPAG